MRAVRRMVWCVLWIIVGLGLCAVADCGCDQGLEPSCYVTFRTNELVSLSVVFPFEFFAVHATTETPFVLGWAVESTDGALVRSTAFSDVAGWWEHFVWDLTDDAGHEVSPGFYHVIVSTTAGPVRADIRLISCCTPCAPCWSCCLCTTCPRAGDGLCPTECGEPYLVLDVAATTNCCAFSFLVFGESDDPAP